MARFEVKPDPLLSPYVYSYWSVVRDLSGTAGFTITPDSFLELIFFVDPPWIEEGFERRTLPVCTLVSLLDGPLRIAADGVVRCAAVRMHAWAAGMIFRQVETSAQPWFDVTTRFADQIPAVCDALRRGAKREIVALLEQLTRRALADARPTPTALAAARSFVSSPGEAKDKKVAAVAAGLGRSRRQIERQVRSLTHRSPKQLSTLARFQFVRDTLWMHPQRELAALAYDAGYADQAHLTRHFRRCTGQTPSEFLRDCARLKSALHRQNAHDVAFLQDGWEDR